jgi:hypothetical protein
LIFICLHFFYYIPTKHEPAMYTSIFHSSVQEYFSYIEIQASISEV